MDNFEEIYLEYFTDVFKYSLSLCRNKCMAEEITQETFFKALKSIHQFKGECKLRVWLCQIAKHTFYAMCRKQKHFQHVDEIPLYIGGVEESLINNETTIEIHKALQKLNEPYKEVFSLRMFGELSFLHIGEVLNKTESWARVTYHRAKIKLREELK